MSQVARIGLRLAVTSDWFQHISRPINFLQTQIRGLTPNPSISESFLPQKPPICKVSISQLHIGRICMTQFKKYEALRRFSFESARLNQKLPFYRVPTSQFYSFCNQNGRNCVASDLLLKNYEDFRRFSGQSMSLNPKLPIYRVPTSPFDCFSTPISKKCVTHDLLFKKHGDLRGFSSESVSLNKKLLVYKVPSSPFHCFSSIISRNWVTRDLEFRKRRGLREFSSESVGLDQCKEVDEINLKFAEAREEIDMALESKETVYFDEEAESARVAVKDVLDMYEGLLAKLSDGDKGVLRRSMGLKIEQLKAELDQLND